MINRVGAAVAPNWPSLDADDIVRNAKRKAGSDRAGDEGFLTALPVLLAAVEREAKLNWIGRIACRQSLAMALESRFGLYRYRAEHPEIAAVPIVKPVFIIGLPRTGTTVLFNLFGSDPANRTPLGWETQFPNPPPSPEDFHDDPRIARARKYFGQMDKMAPNLASMHEVGAELPQECMPILAHSLLSPQASITFNAPSYQDWVDQQDATPSYRYHRHFLEHLQSKCMKDRWVLKSPVHLATLDTLLAQYPDARIVFTHRDPVKTIPSLASLVYTVRGIVTDHVDPRDVGVEQLRWWGRALDHALEVRAAHQDKESQFVDVQFEEVVADPVATMERIYRELALPWTDEAEHRMRGFLSENPRTKHGVHTYELEDFGLERDEIRARFSRYCEAHEVPPAD
ncbi:MAG: sulfotransferase [Myxococcota bacterium]